jgi:two-component sensor histidine kinase
VPLGLIVNELISNALKHAFRSLESGRITIVLAEQHEFVELRVSDNGIGFPSGYNVEQSVSVGLSIVSMLTQQIDGTMSIGGTDGTTAIVRFPLDL